MRAFILYERLGFSDSLQTTIFALPKTDNMKKTILALTVLLPMLACSQLRVGVGAAVSGSGGSLEAGIAYDAKVLEVRAGLTGSAFVATIGKRMAAGEFVITPSAGYAYTRDACVKMKGLLRLELSKETWTNLETYLALTSNHTTTWASIGLRTKL